LSIQIGVLAACIVAVAQLAAHFPFPSPLIKPLLSPRLRWPTAQVESWVESGNFNGGFLAYFARDPERIVPPGANGVSPADGVVTGIPIQDGITYFVVALSFWDVHVVRTPVAGVVMDVEQEGVSVLRRPGPDYLKESIFLKGKAAPVQEIITLDSDYGRIRLRLITSYFASRLKTWVHVGQHLEKGERVGRILLGSTVVTEFPGTPRLSVQTGNRMVGGETIILEGSTSQ
jgi:phosphatidylserine decarboxylase